MASNYCSGSEVSKLSRLLCMASEHATLCVIIGRVLRKGIVTTERSSATHMQNSRSFIAPPFLKSSLEVDCSSPEHFRSKKTRPLQTIVTQLSLTSGKGGEGETAKGTRVGINIPGMGRSSFHRQQRDFSVIRTPTINQRLVHRDIDILRSTLNTANFCKN